MKKTSKAKLFGYFKGFLYSILATVIFVALDWIKVPGGLHNTSSLYIVPAIAFVSWTLIYFVWLLAWAFLAIFASFTFGIGFLIGLGVIGYFLLKVTDKVLPPDWVVYTSDDIALFVMGTFYSFACVIFREK